MTTPDHDERKPMIAGRYQVIRQLATGGMGRVVEAIDLHSDRRVALKLPTEQLLPDSHARERFVRDAQACIALSHPHVVKVLDVVTDDSGAPVIVLELLDGHTLAATLKRKGRLSVAETARCMLPVIEALDDAHRAGLVHRDFTPHNIFLAQVSDTLVPKLLDFGITKVVHGPLSEQASPTTTGSLVGTPHYMAPEQVYSQSDIDARADVWAAGVVLYECLCGQRPFEGQGMAQILSAILRQPPIPLIERVDDIPAALAIAVSHALTVEREDRPRNVGGLLAALDPYKP